MGPMGGKGIGPMGGPGLCLRAASHTSRPGLLPAYLFRTLGGVHNNPDFKHAVAGVAKSKPLRPTRSFTLDYLRYGKKYHGCIGNRPP